MTGVTYSVSGSARRFASACMATSLLILSCLGSAFAAEQNRFATPEEGVKALIAAAAANDSDALMAMLGPGSEELVSSGDEVADQNSRQRVAEAYAEANRIEMDEVVGAILYLGKNDWQFPIPLVKDDAGWRFDTETGKEEILNRRIGRNELDTIQTALAFVDAQREYYVMNPTGDGVLQYAQKFASDPGKRNGLYWPAEGDATQSPLGLLVAEARAEGYRKKKEGEQRTPYHGYYFRILTGQGKNAPGSAYDYLAGERMIGGFALVAWPAEYGNSGIMTFLVNHDGVVYEKDLGEKTEQAVEAITLFDPDPSWKKAEQTATAAAP